MSSLLKLPSKQSIFYKVGNVSLVRTKKQAIGFYLYYVVVFMFLIGTISGIIAHFSGLGESEAALLGQKVSKVLSPVSVATFSAYILYKKRRLLTPVTWIQGALAVVASLIFGALIGFVLVAYLTTLGRSSSTKNPEQ